jgi:uncharacterized protein YbaR (Trm112 family)
MQAETLVPPANAPERFLDILCCPITRAPLQLKDKFLGTADGRHLYPISAGIPLFAASDISADSQAQKAHYDRIADAYAVNLGYAHTQEYMAYLDRCFLEAVSEGALGTVAGTARHWHCSARRSSVMWASISPSVCSPAPSRETPIPARSSSRATPRDCQLPI